MCSKQAFLAADCTTRLQASTVISAEAVNCSISINSSLVDMLHVFYAFTQLCQVCSTCLSVRCIITPCFFLLQSATTTLPTAAKVVAGAAAAGVTAIARGTFNALVNGNGTALVTGLLPASNYTVSEAASTSDFVCVWSKQSLCCCITVGDVPQFLF